MSDSPLNFAGGIDKISEAFAFYPLAESPKVAQMSKSHWRFKGNEIVRTAKAAKAAGLNVRNIEITEDGTIRVNVGEADKTGAQSTATDTANEWDNVK